MVELQHPDVSGTAVDAWVRPEVVDQPSTRVNDDPALSDARLVEVVLPVGCVVEANPSPSAVHAAPPLDGEL